MLTISKRFEFAASHRLFDQSLSAEKNRELFGQRSEGQYGHGHNYEAYFIFTGPVDPVSGMCINVSTIKEKILPLLARRYDHKYLNIDNDSFSTKLPTAENVALQLLTDSQALFATESALVVAVYLQQDDHEIAIAYNGGRVERKVRIDFSAARRTFSPYLSDKENKELFGVASSSGGHGHHYHLWVTISGEVDVKTGLVLPYRQIETALQELHDELDHTNLNLDVPSLEGNPITTEYLALHIWKKLSMTIRVDRIRLNENEKFFVELANSSGEGCRHFMGVIHNFSASHRLHSPKLTDDENLELYGKCNNLAGHGHLYRVESTFEGKIDQRTGTLFDLLEINDLVQSVLKNYDRRHLDLETDFFTGSTSTGENIVQSIWDNLSATGGTKLARLRLWETNNNRFTLRNEASAK